MLDIDKARRETRGTSRVAHLNNCGASLPPDAVVDAIVQHLNAERDLGPYEAAAAYGDAMTRLYDAAASLIGCEPEEIAFCDSATRAWNVLVYSLPLHKGDRILVSPIEFGSALIAVQHVAERCGAEVEILPADENGRIRVDQFERSLARGQPRLVAVTHAAAHSGAVNPVEDIGQLAKKAGAFYLVDACQSLGQMPVSVNALHCDALTATGRKWLRGPRGTGFLYVRKEAAASIDPVTVDLVTADYLSRADDATGSHLRIRPDTRKFELWERSIAAAIGLGVALQYCLDLTTDDDTAYRCVRDLAQYTVDRLRELATVRVWAPPRAESGVVGFTMEGLEPKAIKAACAGRAINISTMADYDAPLDFARRSSSGVCRVAPHYYNTTSEVDAFMDAIRNLQ
jgi:selenocysteine lyase/cysteine desulfurase